MADTGPATTPAATLTDAIGSWQLDPAATTVELHTKAMWGLVKVNGRFQAVEGHGTVDAETGLSGVLVVDAKSVDTKSKKRDDHLRSDDFFDAEKYPTFTYTATGATPADDGKLKVTGTLTIKDQTRPLDLVVTASTPSPDHAKLVGEAHIDRGDWGISWSKMGARLANHIAIEAHFKKTEPTG
jgi:polyisoprenoid-binding protein YceI